MLKEYDTDRDGKLGKDEVPKNWHPATWSMQDLDKDGLLDAKDWQYYRCRRTSSNSAMAVKLGGRGDVTATHVLWRYDKSLPDVPGVLLYRGVLYLVRNGGIVQTLDPATGKLLKMGRLDACSGRVLHVACRGRRQGLHDQPHWRVSVLTANAEWTVASTGNFEEEVFATPAIADGHIWVRTATALYDFAR